MSHENVFECSNDVFCFLVFIEMFMEVKIKYEWIGDGIVKEAVDLLK